MCRLLQAIRSKLQIIICYSKTPQKHANLACFCFINNQSTRILTTKQMHPLFPDHAGMSTSAFAHRNPPRSLWLQLVHRTCCLTRRARPLKLTLFLYKSTRRSRGETIGTHIDKDSSLIMPLRLRGGYATECHAFSYYAHKAHARRKQANKGMSQKDESAVFVVWEEEHKESKRTTATSCGWSNGACVRRKFGAHMRAALRLVFRLRKRQSPIQLISVQTDE